MAVPNPSSAGVSVAGIFTVDVSAAADLNGLDSISQKERPEPNGYDLPTVMPPSQNLQS